MKGPKTSYDWRQTPYGGKEIINYARHATATCCRSCLQYWYDIDENSELTEKQLQFCSDLIMYYVEQRVDLNELVEV
jgi:hypothetical protein